MSPRSFRLEGDCPVENRIQGSGVATMIKNQQYHRRWEFLRYTPVEIKEAIEITLGWAMPAAGKVSADENKRRLE